MKSQVKSCFLQVSNVLPNLISNGIIRKHLTYTLFNQNQVKINHTGFLENKKCYHCYFSSMFNEYTIERNADNL